MKKYLKASSILFCFSGICFMAAGLLSKNTVFIVLGCSFIAISLTSFAAIQSKKDDTKK